MAQSGFTPISLYFSATGAAVPIAGNLVDGELALNTNDGKLYYKNSSGVVTLLAGATAGPAGGSTTQVQYNNAGVLAGITGATTNGTALTLVAPVLGTPASGIVTNLTGTASININGTVGATTANTGAFTTINASGTVAMAGAATVGTTLGVTGTSSLGVVNASGIISAPVGSVGSPSFSFTGDTTLGMYRVGAQNGGLVASSGVRLQWDGTSVYVNNLVIDIANANANISRLGAGSLAIGTGAIGSTAGSLSLTNLTASGTTTSTGFIRSFATSNTVGTPTFYLSTSVIREGADASFNVDTFDGAAYQNRLKIVGATGAVTIPGTLGVAGAATIGAASAGVGALTINHATQPAIYLAKTNATATTWQIYNNGNLQFYDGTNTPLYFVGAASTFGGAVTMSSGATIGTGSNVLGFKVGWLTATNTKSSSTALTTLSDLTIAIGAGETWLIEYTLAATSNLEQTGISLQVDTPASATQDIFYEYIPERYDLVGGLYTAPVGCVFQTASGTLVSWTAADIVFGGKAAINVFVRVTASGAGNVTLGYAQETSTGTNLNILRGSRVKAQRTA